MQPTLSISHLPITLLEFVQCSSALGFNYLIHICDNLTSFKYTQQEDNNLPTSLDYNSVYFKSLQPAPFAEVLSTRRDTLRSITIDISRHSYNYGGVHSDDWIGGMAEYTNLRFLQIRAPNFIGRGRAARFDGTATPRMNLVEFLPTSLEELWTTDISHETVRTITTELVAMVTTSAKRFVKLRKIDVEESGWLKPARSGGGLVGVARWREMYPDYQGLLESSVLVQMEGLERVSEEAGIEFRVRDRSVEAVVDEVDDVFLFAREAF